MAVGHLKKMLKAKRSGGGVEKCRLKQASAKVKVEVEAELGNILRATTSINFKHFGNNEWMR